MPTQSMKAPMNRKISIIIITTPIGGSSMPMIRLATIGRPAGDCIGTGKGGRAEGHPEDGAGGAKGALQRVAGKDPWSSSPRERIIRSSADHADRGRLGDAGDAAIDRTEHTTTTKATGGRSP